MKGLFPSCTIASALGSYIPSTTVCGETFIR